MASRSTHPSPQAMTKTEDIDDHFKDAVTTPKQEENYSCIIEPGDVVWALNGNRNEAHEATVLKVDVTNNVAQVKWQRSLYKDMVPLDQIRPMFDLAEVSGDNTKNSSRRTRRKSGRVLGLKQFIQRRIAMLFGGHVYFGTVTECREGEDGEETLWHVKYDDGDAEDMNRQELDAALELYELRRHTESPLLKEDGSQALLKQDTSDDATTSISPDKTKSKRINNTDRPTPSTNRWYAMRQRRFKKRRKLMSNHQRPSSQGLEDNHDDSSRRPGLVPRVSLSPDHVDHEDEDADPNVEGSCTTFKDPFEFSDDNDDSSRRPVLVKRVSLSPDHAKQDDEDADDSNVEVDPFEFQDDTVSVSDCSCHEVNSDNCDFSDEVSSTSRDCESSFECDSCCSSSDVSFDGYEEEEEEEEEEDSSLLQDALLPSPEEQQRILDSIESPSDKTLQSLLWSLGFSFTLLPHQFEGVRAVAGVSNTFPLNDAAAATAEDYFNSSTDPTTILKNYNPTDETSTRGILLADSMGLGKTVQSIGGAILRNKLCEAQGKEGLPTVIVAPNENVLTQWGETLLNAGVSSEKIFYFRPRKHCGFDGPNFILMTRYNLQGETKALMERITDRDKGNQSLVSSKLFPYATKDLLYKMKNQYESFVGKARNQLKLRDEKEVADVVVSRLLLPFVNRDTLQQVFRTVLIDEAHFLRSICSYWGLGAAMMGLHGERVVPLTGTPYNNGPKDMAALMTFIDPSKPAAKTLWWANATKLGTPADIVQSVGEWRTHYMLRRGKDVLKKQLPDKKVFSIPVSSYPAELYVYNYFEQQMLEKLAEFGKHDSSEIIILRNLFKSMLATLSCQRMALIHPMLPGGREMTKMFSPSRRKMVKMEERPCVCVCCTPVSRPSVPLQRKSETGASKQSLPNKELRLCYNMDLDDSDLDDGGEEEVYGATCEEDELVPLCVEERCDSTVPHYAHRKCRDELRRDKQQCPRCVDMKRRVHNMTNNNEDGSAPFVSQRTTYCQHVSVSPSMPGGFKASAKIESVINWFRCVPTDEKAIILSFFKGGLDLIEGILVEHLEVGCARFDGDVNAKVRAQELQRFKTNADCRVLLASVQCGGTGLNIVEANNVCFVDRWFNPCVHEQAMDRCHRIKQQKEVKVVFHDCSKTVDQVMSQINKIKSENASIVLADGTALGQTTGGIKFKDMNGMIGSLLREVRTQRMESPNDQPLSQANLDDMETEEKRMEKELAKAIKKARMRVGSS